MPSGELDPSSKGSAPVQRGELRLPPEPLDEGDTPAEVDAVFRVQRRIAFGYFSVFLLVTFAVPALTLLLDWWSAGRLLGGMTPNFAMVAFGLYVFFFALAAAASTLASAVEDRMLGGPGWRDRQLDEELDGHADPAALDDGDPSDQVPATEAGGSVEPAPARDDHRAP